MVLSQKKRPQENLHLFFLYFQQVLEWECCYKLKTFSICAGIGKTALKFLSTKSMYQCIHCLFQYLECIKSKTKHVYENDRFSEIQCVTHSVWFSLVGHLELSLKESRTCLLHWKCNATRTGYHQEVYNALDKLNSLTLHHLNLIIKFISNNWQLILFSMCSL